MSVRFSCVTRFAHVTNVLSSEKSKWLMTVDDRAIFDGRRYQGT